MKHPSIQFVLAITCLLVVSFSVAMGEDRNSRKGIDEHDIDMAIKVLIDIRPELKGKIENNASVARKIVSEYKHVGSFASLLTLKSRSPDLYQLRIDEIKVNSAINHFSIKLELARNRNDIHASEKYALLLKENIRKQHELKIKSAQFRINRIKSELAKEESKLMELIANQDTHISKQLNKHQKSKYPHSKAAPLNYSEHPVQSHDESTIGKAQKSDFALKPAKHQTSPSHDAHDAHTALDAILPETALEKSPILSKNSTEKPEEAKRDHIETAKPKVRTQLKSRRVSKSEWRKMTPEQRRAYLSAIRDSWHPKKR